MQEKNKILQLRVHAVNEGERFLFSLDFKIKFVSASRKKATTTRGSHKDNDKPDLASFFEGGNAKDFLR